MMIGFPARLKKLFHPRAPGEEPSVHLTQDGLKVICGNDVLSSIRWSDIQQIIVYKNDNFTTDDICVGFLAETDPDSWLEINEDWSGFQNATNRMEELFPSIPKDWFNDVMVPPFARNATVLYDKNFRIED